MLNRPTFVQESIFNIAFLNSFLDTDYTGFTDIRGKNL